MVENQRPGELDDVRDDKSRGGWILEIEDLHVEFGRQHVLRGVDLRIPHGQTLAIIGESGCGKTVLLKTMIGLITPTRGRILFDGIPLHGLDQRRLAELRVRFGFVFQQAALFDSMTIGQNVAFPLRQHRRMSEQAIQQVVRDSLALVGLPESVMSKRPAELSGGMRKRVGLARALVMSPELILYDEPTTGLDPIMSDVINELILMTSHRAGVTSVFVTHDMHSVRKVAQRVVMLYPTQRLRAGATQIIFDGTPDELNACEDPRVRQFVRGEAGERLTEMQPLNREEA